MDCASVLFSRHALRRMFECGMKRDTILETIRHGEEIAGYPDDRPCPSWLMLGFIGNEPDPDMWSDDFRTRRQS